MSLLRWDYNLSDPIMGITLNSARNGEAVQVQSRGFFTSDDGPELYTFLDAFYDVVLAPGVPLQREHIQSAFVSIIDGTKATAIINAPTVLGAFAKGAVEKGERVTTDHLADIAAATIRGYDFPECGAIAYLFQSGWRRGFYFDFTAHDVNPPSDRPLGNVSALLGSLHSALMLRERVRMDSSVLRELAASGWFPFTRLPERLARALYLDAENKWELGETASAIVHELGPQVGAIVEAWASKPAFAPHMGSLREAAGHYAKAEYLAASNIVSLQSAGPTGRRTQPRARGRSHRRHL